MILGDAAEPDPWHFPRPELADSYLSAFELKLSSARGLFARRRMGKTEFLLRDLLPAAVKRGYLAAYTNLWDIRSAPQEALISALEDALAPQGVSAVLARPRKPIKKIKASAKVAGAAEGSLEADLAPSTTENAANLREILKRLDSQEKPLLLLIDEAQVLARAGHSDFAHALRAALDTRKSRIKVIFAGSSEATLREMFARTSEPFYNWAALEPFPLLGEEFVAFTIDIMNGMAKYGLSLEQGTQAFDALHRTPEFFKRFIERYMLYQTQGADAALEHTKASVFSDQHFLAQWSAMHPADQAVLTVLARGGTDIHGTVGLAQLSTILGKSVTKNTGAHALRRLREENVVTRLAFGDYRIEDEAFAEWIRRRAARSASDSGGRHPD